jgi:predicted acylesterase/phospholipase RssA
MSPATRLSIARVRKSDVRGRESLHLIRVLAALSVCLAAVLPAGCATLEERNAVPTAQLAQMAALPNLPGVRGWGDEVPADVGAEFRRRFPNLPRLAHSAATVGDRPVVEVLALSGGGGDGAFGAGLLAGWTKRGDRPTFEVVTGVSAGAMIAPFAFLGPNYDRQLREIWTQYETNELVERQSLPGLFTGPALADTAPLAKLIAKYVDRRMLAEIAAEYRKGRLLLIATTNLDAERPVVWNMGEIAINGHPTALNLFRRVILASASIPGAFPPVDITVEADGKTYQEMHVDGGITREVFVAPLEVPFKQFDRFYDAPPLRRLYIVKNGKLAPEYRPVQKQTIPIAARAIFTLIKSQHQGDIYRIYRMARDAGAEFRLAAVPDTFNKMAKQAFDPEYQTALFDEGHRLALSGNPWLKAPPSLRSGALRSTPGTN